MGERVPYPVVATAWLSADMAHALAAMSPPLETHDVLDAADKLTTGSATPAMVDHLLRCGADLMTVRQVLEALRALREARLSESMQRLLLVLSELASPAGAQALFARARHVARDVDNGHTAEFGGGTQAVLSVLLDLIVAFIGADLSAGLVRQVWPDAAVPESASGASSAGRNL